MKKNGFTLIELIISISLASVVLMSMMGTLIKLRQAYTVVDKDTDILLDSSTITRIISNDIFVNSDIVSITCSVDGAVFREGNTYEKLYITLGNKKKRLLEIIPSTDLKNNSTTVKTTISDKDGNDTGTKETTKTTIKYSDITDQANIKLLYIKTLEYVSETYNNGGGYKSGYAFAGLESYRYVYPNVKRSDTVHDILYKITVLTSDSNFDFSIYSNNTEQVYN